MYLLYQLFPSSSDFCMKYCYRMVILWLLHSDLKLLVSAHQEFIKVITCKNCIEGMMTSVICHLHLSCQIGVKVSIPFLGTSETI